MIHINRLTKRYRLAPALSDVSLAVAPGESVALWGANGAGKTTLIRCLLGLIRYQGAISVDGLDPWRQGKQARRRIGYVPQEQGFYDELRVDEAIRFFARLRCHAVTHADDVLQPVGLVGHSRKRIRELSGGMKQRLALAIALLGEPPMLVLDEVTASLDAGGRDELIEILRQSTQRPDRITLFASHRIEEIARLASRVVTLERGRVISDEPAASFIAGRRQRELLHVFVEPESIGRALDILGRCGFEARRNGQGLHVWATVGSRAEPLNRLREAQIRVSDFEILPPAEEQP